ncbi:MAG: hypothetical protein HYX75_03610 [Acidobacteria bacterium]|nr:hypothetical protein [Acidobacteriota bacterium]
MNRRRLKALACGILASCAIAVGAGGLPSAGAVHGAPEAAMEDLQSIDELRAHFNKDKDAPRLILLLSPT